MKKNPAYTIVVRDAQAAVVRAALANLKQGGYPLADLAGPLEDDLGTVYWTLSGTFTQAQMERIKGAMALTRILKGTSWWDHEGRDTDKIKRDKKLKQKDAVG